MNLNRRMAPECNIRLEVNESFPSAFLEEENTELLRILQEALANARHHSGASHVRVAVGGSGDKLWAEVSDDGQGFDGAKGPTGMGTKGMRETARELGGALKISSMPRRGYQGTLRGGPPKRRKRTRRGSPHCACRGPRLI